jgi:transmembrane sensor
MHDSAEQSAARRLQQVDERWDEARSERALGSLGRRMRRRRFARVSLAVCAAAGFAVAMTFARREPARPMTAAVEIAPPPSSTPAPMHLGDGSIIRPAKGAEVVVREVSAERIRIGLAHGRAGFEVARRPEREFIVDSGAVRVLVVGTRFAVEQAGDRTHVTVEQGHVRVQWGDDVPVTRELGAGEEGTYPPDGEEEIVARDPSPPAAASAPTPRGASPPVKRSHAPGGEWRRLARQGGYREAYDLIVAAGPGVVRDDVNDLLLAADAARLSDDPKRALGYLDRVIDAHARDDRAPMAAFTRGRIYMGLARPGEAADSFDRAVVLGAQGSLHENALARAVEAYARAGKKDRAQALARAYLSRYPDGRWVPMVRATADLTEPSHP